MPLLTRGFAFFLDLLGTFWPLIMLGGDLRLWAVPALLASFAFYGLVSVGAGASVGKLICGLTVVRPDGSPLPLGARVLRTVFQPFCLAAAAATVCQFRFVGPKTDTVSPEAFTALLGVFQVLAAVDILLVLVTRRGLHDFVAGSRVVEKQAAVPEVAAPEGGGGQLTISEDGQVTGLPPEWGPVHKTPTLRLVNLVGTMMSAGTVLDSSGKLKMGNHIFVIAMIPVYSFGRFLYIEDGFEYRFLARAPITPGWRLWNKFGLLLAVAIFAGMTVYTVQRVQSGRPQ